MMQKYVLDECLSSLYRLDLLMENYVELSDYQILFEADNPDVSAQMQKNANIEKESGGFLKKAANGIINMIKSIISSIQSFFQELFMGKDEQVLLNQFRDACKQDPTLKDKKITVTDYKNAMKAYDEKIAEIDQELRKEAAGRTSGSEELINSCTSLLKNGIQSSGSIVASEIAVNLAYNNLAIAKSLQKALNDENAVMQTLMNGLGEKEAKRFKADIEASTKKLSLHRKKVQLMQKKYECAKDCIVGTIQQISGLSKGKIWGNFSFIRKVMNNDTLGPTVKNTAKMTAKSVIKNAKTQAKEKAKKMFKGDYEDSYHATGKDFILGKSKKKEEQ